MPNVACGIVGTGTERVPWPRSPATMTRTCQAPAVIIHRRPVNSFESLGDLAATSATAARTVRLGR